jgi:hypothetical protein
MMYRFHLNWLFHSLVLVDYKFHLATIKIQVRIEYIDQLYWQARNSEALPNNLQYH